MNEDAGDIFREMDTLADYLFARMARDFGTGIQQGYNYQVIIHAGYAQPPQIEGPETIPSRSGSEPVPEVHQIGNELMVIAEIPGATRESLHLTIEGNELIIDADGGSRQYHTVAALPPVDPGSMQTSIKNGVLEVKFRILADRSENEGSP